MDFEITKDDEGKERFWINGEEVSQEFYYEELLFHEAPDGTW